MRTRKIRAALVTRELRYSVHSSVGFFDRACEFFLVISMCILCVCVVCANVCMYSCLYVCTCECKVYMRWYGEAKYQSMMVFFFETGLSLA